MRTRFSPFKTLFSPQGLFIWLSQSPSPNCVADVNVRVSYLSNAFFFSLQPLASGKRSIFKLCLSAEEVPAHLDTYRDKLVCLQKLRFTPALYDSLPDLCRDAALLLISGMLYVNFSPLWDPVIEIIASFAQSSNVMNFWKVFSELLHTSAEKSGNNIS